MATQGIVSVMSDSTMLMKIVVGCDGYNAPKLAEAIRTLGVCPSAREAYVMAEQVGFGEMNCLVVVTREEIYSKCAEEDALEKTLYRLKFHDPQFNPRWNVGAADYIELVHL